MKDNHAKSKEALDYHEFPRPGKLEIKATKPLSSQRDLSLAYTPGVAVPCLKIEKNPDDAYRYTNRGNLVGVITNGTATLGLGDIGPLGAKPVMEGKAILFKHLAGIDAFDIELDLKDPEAIIACVRAMEPTFGGINLEDIKAPECFEIERRLRECMNIPVFHDDQHGTAIITGAALLNALELQGKNIAEAKIVFGGAGAAAISCAHLYEKLGVLKENITVCDSRGVIYKGRKERMNQEKEYFARETSKRTLQDAFVGSDVFVGLSRGGTVSVEMLQSMAAKPIIFALANPDPEIAYEDAMGARDDLIMATGRSDHPNQVNNVLCFPFLFRGALDVWATTINEEMKRAAVEALAKLARADVPEVVMAAYGGEMMTFGKNYIIPKPFDPRILLEVSPAVAVAAEKSGVARRPIQSVQAYREHLEQFQGVSKAFVRQLIHKVREGCEMRRVLFPEGSETKILKAAQRLVEERIATPVLLGDAKMIREKADRHDINLEGVELLDHATDSRFDSVVDDYYQMRQRKGVTRSEARAHMKNREAYSMVLLNQGLVDGVVSGLTKAHRVTLKPALSIVGVHENRRAAGVFITVTNAGVKFFADTTVNIEPSAETLADIAISTAELAQSFDITPRVAMISYSNFGASRHPRAGVVAEATRLVKARAPKLQIDGEMQVSVALNQSLRKRSFPFSSLGEENANIFVFPNLDAANSTYQMLHEFGEAELIGPILLNMKNPVNAIQMEADVDAIINLTVITCLQAGKCKSEE